MSSDKTVPLSPPGANIGIDVRCELRKGELMRAEIFGCTPKMFISALRCAGVHRINYSIAPVSTHIGRILDGGNLSIAFRTDVPVIKLKNTILLMLKIILELGNLQLKTQTISKNIFFILLCSSIIGQITSLCLACSAHTCRNTL